MGSGELTAFDVAVCRVARDRLSKDRIWFLKCFTKDQTGMNALQSYLISFSCFVENNSKTTARVVAVYEICMSTAAVKLYQQLIECAAY